MAVKPWEEHRVAIIRLYIHQAKTLEDVRAIMKARHGFEASTRSYRHHFDLWKVGKYNCKRRRQERRQRTTRMLLPSLPHAPDEAPVSVPGGFSASGASSSPPSSPSPGSVSTRSGGGGWRTRRQRALPDRAATTTTEHRLVNAVTRFPCGTSVPQDLAMLLNDSRILAPGKVEMGLHQPSDSNPVWNMTRSPSSATFQLSGQEPLNYYRLPYDDTVPRCMPDMFSDGLRQLSTMYNHVPQSDGPGPSLS
ncbi:hypothetical protein QQX98_007229 [Neonectria punicea]|uniref:Clr5 domain-containing protein n=1 Tax=Neonectria punicea TaxID=979145 RepID=A0ABR1GYI1_9HYPO